MMTDTEPSIPERRPARGNGRAEPTKRHPTAEATTHLSRLSYGAVWGWLMGLLALGLVLAYLPVPKWIIVTLVFGTAVIKATLVGYHYMHLRFERVVVYTIALTPLLVFAILLFGLMPDIGLRH